jgi:hypothetical protein
MTSNELTLRILGLYKPLGLPAYDPDALAQAMFEELIISWDDLPETTQALMLGVASVLKREAAGAMLSDLQAAEIVERLRK